MKLFKSILIAATLMAGHAWAQTPAVDKLVASLQAEGYVISEIERTWLGRYKIEAYKNGIERELVINGQTGGILRDRIDDDDDDYDDKDKNDKKDDD